MDSMKTFSCLRLSLLPVALAALLGAAPLPAAAQSADDNWRISVAPYLWLPTFNGTLQFHTPGGTSSTVGFKVNPNEYIPDIEMALPLALEARKGKWLAYSDVLYMSLGANEASVKAVDFNIGRGPIDLSKTLNTGTQIDLKATIWTVAGGYNLVQDPKLSLDVIGGARYLYLKATTNWQLSLDVSDPSGSGRVIPRSGSASESGDVWNGIVGVKGRVKLGEGNWFTPFYFDAGTGGSQYTWQAQTGIGYAFRWGDLVLNYRYLAWKADDNSKVIQDLKLYGFGVAGVFHF